jgi:hypothetical protein
MISNGLKDLSNTCWRKYICSVLHEKYQKAPSHIHLVVHKLSPPSNSDHLENPSRVESDPFPFMAAPTSSQLPKIPCNSRLDAPEEAVVEAIGKLQL